jgi:glycosyltransferase involved in cell wall biosynthesis
MIQRPIFSIVIPTYNRLDLLKRALSSVWGQRREDYEVIVVDDGSTDGTREWLLTQDKRVRAITQENSGPGAARNIGIREARGDYVALLDSDDLWFPWTLDIFASAIQQHKYPQILSGRYLEFSDEAELLHVREEYCRTSWFRDYIASSDHPYVVGSNSCVLFREALATENFLEDRLNGEDHDLILRVGASPGFVQVLAPVTVAWRRHPASETADFARSVSGIQRLLAREKSGAYPGGSKRSQERHHILARHTRAVSLTCLRKRALKEGWDLYRSTLGWNIDVGHWKYVLAFPVLAIVALLSRVATRKPR